MDFYEKFNKIVEPIFSDLSFACKTIVYELFVEMCLRSGSSSMKDEKSEEEEEEEEESDVDAELGDK